MVSATASTPSVGQFGFYVAYSGDATYQPSNSADIEIDVAFPRPGGGAGRLVA